MGFARTAGLGIWVTIMPSLSVTVPIHNEAENLSMLYANVREALDQLGQPWELILVDDGSTDGSTEVIEEIAKGDPRVKAIIFRRNAGQTAAMMAGFDHATGNIIIPMDGDLQNDPSDIGKMLEKLDEGYDVVSGWRKDRQDHFVQRNLPSIMANRLISFVSGVRLHDFGCSLKAYRRDVIKGVRLYGEMHRFLPIYASWHGAKITECVVTHHARRHGKSKYGLERVMKVLLDLMVVKFLDRLAQKPMYLFGGVGVAFLGLSSLFALYAIYLKLFASTSFIQTPIPMLSVTTGMLAVICFLMGLLAELTIRTFYEAQGKPVYLVKKAINTERTLPQTETI